MAVFIYVAIGTRTHPYHAKVAVFFVCFCLEKIISVIKFDGKQFSVSDMGGTNVMKAVYALKILFL